MARNRLIGSRQAATVIVITDGCSAPNTSSALSLPTTSQRNGSIVRVSAPETTNVMPMAPASVATICVGDASTVVA